MDSPPKSGREAVLSKLFRPATIAIIGASPKPGSARNTIVRVIQRHEFAGTIYPVNPSHTRIEGLTAYPSIAALPTIPDLALIITPAETVADIIEECGRKGVPAAIVYSAGFEEVESGKEYARLLAASARRHSVTVLGPNCQGIWSVNSRAILSFSNAALSADNLKAAPIAVVSQSGALSSAIATYLQKTGIGSSYIVSVGNETCMDLIDVLEWMVEQDDVRVIALYLEGLNAAVRLMAVARRACARGIQIVALKAGRSKAGQIATASHTGKIASSHVVYEDAFEQAGIIAVDTLAEMLAAIEVLGYMPPPRISGDPLGGVAILSSSGGAGALLADQSEQFAIPMSEFGATTIEKLDTLLPEFAHKANPVDLTGQIYSIPNLFENACAAIGGDMRTEAMVVQFAGGGLRNVREYGEAFKAAAKQGGFPMILSFVAEIPDRETQQSFRDDGILFTSDTAAAMRALGWLYQRQRFAARPRVATNPPLPPRAAPADWVETMRFCEGAAITPARWTLLGRGDSAATACAGMRYPLVVKVLPSDCEHKTEMGLVKLRIASPEAVDAHAAAFREKLGKPGAGILVQEMVDGGVEVVLSCLRNTDFGPVLSIGSGGIAIELYRDVGHLVLPVTGDEVIAALGRLKLWTLLGGFRGQPRADIEALARAAARLGDLFLATPELEEFEINPLFVRRAGEGIVAVDALLTSRTSTA